MNEVTFTEKPKTKTKTTRLTRKRTPTIKVTDTSGEESKVLPRQRR